MSLDDIPPIDTKFGEPPESVFDNPVAEQVATYPELIEMFPKGSVGESVAVEQALPLQIALTPNPNYSGTVDGNFFVRWGTVNGVEPDNINDPFTVAESTVWVFMECDLQGDPGQSANLVTACRIVTGASSTAHVTPGFGSDGSLPANAYISLGRVQVTGDQKSIINSGNGSIMLAAHITNLTCITGGGPRISRQLSHWRLNP